MLFRRSEITGVLLLTPTKHEDQRGFLSETYRWDVLAAEGVKFDFVQDNHVCTKQAGVLRGLHFQIAPKTQGKLVRCSKGAILSVAVDLRTGSPTYRRHVAVELSADNWQQLWVPPGFAHGYITLRAESDAIYKTTEYYAPDCDRGIAWDDPELGIDWKIEVGKVILSDKHRRQPRLAEVEPVFEYTH